MVIYGLTKTKNLFYFQAENKSVSGHCLRCVMSAKLASLLTNHWRNKSAVIRQLILALTFTLDAKNTRKEKSRFLHAKYVLSMSMAFPYC